MNTLIEHLNAWGEQSLRFAGSMLWQSSLLIGLLLALEWTLRRRVRAAVRYGLWLLVLLKLLLPPTLALPMGPSRWLHPAAARVPEPRITTVVVTYGPGQPYALPETAPPGVVQTPRARLSTVALALAGSVAVSLGFLGWIVVRWRQATRQAQRAATAPEWLDALLHEAQQSLGLRGRVRLRLLETPVTPAVCGLLRPVILLPRFLAERLPRAQLRAVLLHELAHLRRADVWVNCAQALLQVVYWWHPLFWLANARIRRLREEAVDDVVMVALREEAETYAPTLLEVAKLALQRPVASLGLVGILESHSFLRQRIERLLDFRPPRRTGLTFASALCVVAFGALALPMGEGPSRSKEASGAPASDTEVKEDALVVPKAQPVAAVQEYGKPLGFDWYLGDLLRSNGIDPRTFKRTMTANPTDAPFTLRGILTDPQFRVVLHALEQQVSGAPKSVSDPRASLTTVYDGILLYEQGKLEEAEKVLNRACQEDPDNVAAYYLMLVSEAHTNEAMSWSNLLSRGSVRSDVIPGNNARKAVYAKLTSLRLSGVAFDDLPLGEVVRRLNEETRKADPQGEGVAFTIADAAAATASPAGSGADQLPDIRSSHIRLSHALPEATLEVILEAIIKTADMRLSYSVEETGVRFSPRLAKESPMLFTRQFKVDNRLLAELNDADLGTAQKSLRDLFASKGVTLNPPRSMFINARTGQLYIRGTREDLDVIENIIHRLTSPPAGTPSQLQIETKAFVVPEDPTGKLQGTLGPQAGSTNLVRVLTRSQAAEAINVLQGKPDAVRPVDSSETIPSGRQMHLRFPDAQPQPLLPDPQALPPANRAGAGARGVVDPEDSGAELRRSARVLTPSEAEKAIQLIQKAPEGFRFVGSSASRSNSNGSSIPENSSNPAEPQINVKARFFDLSEETAGKVWNRLGLEVGNTNFMNMLTPTKMKGLLEVVESDPQTEPLGAPEATTLSGRRMQCLAFRTLTLPRPHGLTQKVFFGPASARSPAFPGLAGPSK